MNRTFIAAFLILCATLANAQNKIMQRIILIGDAGELDEQQHGVLTSAAAAVIKGKTNVFYLGDNIYPTGMGLPGDPDEETTKKILQAQYQPMRAAGAPVFFVPGNHDWDRMGPKGLAKIKRQWEYLKEQKDTLLKMVPENGCPGPTEINISDDVTVLAFDSEWWLYIYNKDNPNADCDCNSNEEIINRFEELLYKNRDKIIILADHHPFKTYGHHGGSYIWQDYVFPLTSVNSKLYIPLPVIGALYPFLRRTFDNPEDNGHPLYRNMINSIEGVFKDDPNAFYVSGHEHGLQFIKDGDRYQVVSGSGAKQAAVKKGKDALYAATVPGYVTVDIMDDKSTKFTYYAGKPDSPVVNVFTYTKPFVKIKIPIPKIYSSIKGDSVTVTAFAKYDSVGRVHRWLYGENYRKEWAAPATVPVIRISDYKGGLTPVRFGGAHQTQSLLLVDKQGKEYILSNIQKYPKVELPQALRQTFARSWFKDAMSAQHPYGALMASVLARAVKVAHTEPDIGWVAPDAKLGFYEKSFAGTLSLIEAREPGDSSINTGLMLKALDGDYHNHIDTSEFFRARMLDWFLGDWDRHEDEWRWIGAKKGTETYFTSVPHDRAEVFFINQGLIPRIASRQWVLRYLKGYSAGPKAINDFYLNDHVLNTRFMTSLDHEKWMMLTRNFANALTDAVLEESLRQLPLSSYRIRHDELLKLMKKRRDKLLIASENYYKFFNKRVDIKATDNSELFLIKDTLNGGMTITINKLPAGHKKYNTIFHRSFDPTITKEIRLYISKGDDSVYVNTTSPIKLRIIGGNGHKLYDIANASRKVNVYEKLNTATFTGPSENFIDKHLSNDTSNVGYIPTNLYNTIIPLLKTGYNVDDGYYIDGGIKYLHQGFRKQPGSSQQFILGHSFNTNANRLSYTGEWNSVIDKADAMLEGRLFFPTSINFFGRGNQTPFVKTGDWFDYYRVRYNFYTLDATLRFKNKAGVTSLRLGPSVQYYHLVNDDGPRLIDNSSLIHSYDSTTINKDKLHIGFVATYINDKRNNPLLPAWGVYINLRIQAYAGAGQYAKSFAQFVPQIEMYKSVDASSNFIIVEKIGGGVTWGKTTYYQSMFLGGEEHMMGYKEYRYAGQHMFYNNLETRIKLSNFLPYILPGQFGVTGFYDIGRVWVKQEDSNAWHNGFGAGVYFSPADMALFKFKMGYSKEGWYPYVSLHFTF